ncbi:MAG: ATP-binding protein [Candidatus Competibacteraceae bacterium]
MRLRQVVMNLINNALKFTEHGEVRIRSTVLEQTEDRLCLEVSVKDTGIGIDPRNQATIFDAFSQADGSVTRNYGGTGLGLAISQRLVKLMGGAIKLDSAPGRGSTFWFRVWLEKSPRAVEENQPVETLSAVATQTTELKPQQRVLLAEDNPINQEVALAMMQQLGLTIDVAKNGVEAIEAFKRNRYNLVLMDCQMPQLDGFKATTALRAWERKQNRVPVPIIALTANVLEGDKERCLEVGMNDYLAKPFNYQQLKNKLEFYLG